MAGIVVLGAGVAGEAFVAALRRHDPNVPVALVERELVGGECSYWACIPSKTLLRPLEVAYRARVAPGVREALGRVDVAAVFAWRDSVAGKDDTSQAEWVRNLDVELVRGSAEVVEPGRVRVGRRDLEYVHLVVATGSLPSVPPIDGLEDGRYWTSRDATSASEVPEALVVVGGGAVGCELAQFYARVGSRVTLVQRAHLLERGDREAGEVLADALREEGIDVRTGTSPSRLERGGPGFRLGCEGEMSGEIEGTHLLVATGRRPNVEGYGLDRLPISLARTGIEVDDHLRAADGVWGAGDVTGVALFTHVGKYQGRVAAANVAGKDVRADYRATPSVVFTDPQVASVGDTSGAGAAVATARLENVSRTATYERPKRPGFVKLFADPVRGVLVGAVAVGPEAGEWLGQLTLAVRAEIPVDILRDTIQPFPTFSEAVFFAARDLPL
ncbi:MAG: NAD(P)/FAD-dependent oxidoreductase [Actinomycetota bacterium]|nr:NAD(P)/FAD-dependent oxidoreductase [Actinomycetota bacterium]